MQVPVQWQGRRGQWTWKLWNFPCQDHSAPASLALEACAKCSFVAVIPYQQHGQEKCGLQDVMPTMLECWALGRSARAAKDPTQLGCKAVQGWPQLGRRLKKEGGDGLEVRRGLWTLIELLQAYSGINEGKILILCMHSQKWTYAKPK